MKKLLLLFWLFLASPALAAVSFDPGAVAIVTGTVVDTLSVNLSVGGGCANPIIVAVAAWADAINGIGSITSFNIGGSGATFVNGVSPGSAAINRRIEMWRQVGVSTGANTVQVNLQFTVQYVTLEASSYCGVHQVTSTGTSATADNNGNNAIATVDVSSAADELVVDGVMTAAATTTITVDGSQTQRANDPTHVGIMIVGMSEEVGAGTTTMSWTTDTDDYTGIIAVALKPAAVPAARRRVVVIQ